MTQESINQIELRLLDLRKQYSEVQWRDHAMLQMKVDELESFDLPLAYRLMQRVKNLHPSADSMQRLSELKTAMQRDHPEIMKSHSTGNRVVSGVKSNAKQALMSIRQKATVDNGKALLKPFTFIVIFPFLLFAIYQVLWASDRYESRTQLIIKQPDGMQTLDPAMALLSGFGGTPSSNDNELVKAFILSNDMIGHLDSKLNIVEHYAKKEWDVFSRLDNDATIEDIHAYFSDMVSIEIDAISGLITISVQGFTPDFARNVALAIVERAEWYINEIGHDLAKEQLAFVINEHKMVEKRLQNAKSALLNFQREYDLLDPEAEGMAFQQITYQLEGSIASTQAKLAALLTGMSEKAPQVMRLRAELDSLEGELAAQRARLSDSSKGEGGKSVGEILAKFSDYKIDMELALKAYTASQVSLEKSRIEAYRQLKYLVTVETATLAQDAKYPEVTYNLILLLVVLCMLFIIGRIVSATVNELR
ncbi:lipopolysaccharide biosynthesis protein [Aliiglaciecola sp.]|nr:lipopolysaccharide biosynthesis protein [Aliiglaciecola sp.]